MNIVTLTVSLLPGTPSSPCRNLSRRDRRRRLRAAPIGESFPRRQQVLEFGRERGGLDGYKVTLEVTCPDAFTLTETVKGGVPLKDYQRFVRATPARSP